MEGFSLNTLIIGIIITWTIGLLPPLLIRYVFIKRAIAKKPAYGICVFFWLVNLILFTAMGSQSKSHAALLLIAYVSYWILRPSKHQLRNIKLSIKLNKDRNSKKIQTKDPSYVRCSNCDFEQWEGYKNCQKCGSRFV
jgi:hypothetical protein